MNITTESRIGAIAAEHPRATKVFARHGIDFCCGGGKPLAEVCATKGLDADSVVAEIRRAVEDAAGSDVRWRERPAGELIDHIVAVHHRPLAEELPRLDFMCRKVASVHHDKDPERLEALVETFAGLKAELEEHMAKEERDLFPKIRAGEDGAAGEPLGVLHDEHELVGRALARIRELTDDYTVPPEACNTWRALWHGLADLERDLHEHIHLENNVLFPAVGAN